jgi:hypothetical protein
MQTCMQRETSPSSLDLGIRRARHLREPHVYALPARCVFRLLRRPPPLQPQTRFLPRPTRQRFPNPRFRRWTGPADLPTARPSAIRVCPGRMPTHSDPAFSSESCFPRSRSSCRPFSLGPSFSQQLFSERPSSSLPSWELSASALAFSPAWSFRRQFSSPLSTFSW